MTLQKLKAEFYHEVTPSHPNEWEVEEVLEPLVDVDYRMSHAILSYVHVIWPVSHSLCFSYLHCAIQQITILKEELLSEWIRRILSRYEKGGLREARAFMNETGSSFFDSPEKESEVQLRELLGTLLPFVRGISGRDLDLGIARYPWTDTETLYLPERFNFFGSYEDNRKLYTYHACCQVGLLQQGTLHFWLKNFVDEEWSEPPNHDFESKLLTDFDQFDDPQFAQNLFHLQEFYRLYRHLSLELPGLIRQAGPLLQELLTSTRVTEGGTQSVLGEILLTIIRGTTVSIPGQPSGLFTSESVAESIANLPKLYSLLQGQIDEREWNYLELMFGRIDYVAAAQCIVRRALKIKAVLVENLATLVASNLPTENDEKSVENKQSQPEQQAIPAVKLISSQGEDDSEAEYILQIDNRAIEIPPELLETLKQLTSELGGIPEGFVQAAAGLAGQGVLKRAGAGQPVEQYQNPLDKEAVLYDEWDFRRQGYRKDWCALYEKEIQPVRSLFVENTLQKYSGLLSRIRVQFEMLRTQHKFVRRRRYGDDIDFDALVEAIGDQKAGLTPSDNLFIRLIRNDRDIAVKFLVDMSNSTEGWVGKAIKETLILLCDVLEIVGDRYGIFGFSGMRRSRSELFCIKHLEEQYSQKVQQKICGIAPREYTRMATPIRHLTQRFQTVDAKIKLLITLSDGKPEDYDDYHGDYAIEDTRKALIEARSSGVTPFCITVDREPHSYLPHMYGKGNYIYVDSVMKLPARMVEMYRLLTS